MLSITGAFIDVFVSSGSGGLNLAAGVGFGPDGDLYVADQAGGQVLRYDGHNGGFLNVFIPAGAGGLFGGTEALSMKDRTPHRLSGGEKKRVALASMLVLDPEVLLLDEPTATLDPRSRSQIIDILAGWNLGVKAVIAATHDLGALEDIADQCYVLDSDASRQKVLPTRFSAMRISSRGQILLRRSDIGADRAKIICIRTCAASMTNNGNTVACLWA